MVAEAVALGSKGWLYHPDYPDHWERCSLYSMAEWVNGLAFRDIHFSPSGMPVIKIAEIKGGISGQTKFTQQTFDESVRVRPGDLLFSWSGQPETSIDAYWWRGPEGWLNQHVFRVTPSDGIDSAFFYYLLRYLKPNFVGIARNKQTTGLGHVTKHDLENIEGAYPPLPEQRAIAHILGTLDDKIELLRRQNETLEAMARALFKAWFVDFEPVRAKMHLPSPSGRGGGGEGKKLKLPSDLRDFARSLRQRMTDAEALLWRLLRGRQLAGVKFRRQHPFPPYVLDFYCHEHKLVVEIDGGQHNEDAGRRHDTRRDAFLAEHGLRVLRFWNHDVLQQTEAVLEAIFQAIVEQRSPSPPPPLPGGEGSKHPSLPTPLPEGDGDWGRLGADGTWHWPQHILDLFPDRLAESELGEIPEGWVFARLGDIADHLRRGIQPNSIKPGTTYIAAVSRSKCNELTKVLFEVEGLGHEEFGRAKPVEALAGSGIELPGDGI
ncbi:MAG: DUF559 domain-containing protein, partial [Rhodocyclaceae bacterium]|nr:DUF559 domain-containing protein [Rhodocyclaceae bacterium]